MSNPTRVLFMGTHPYSTNGYSYVTIELTRQMALRPDIKLSVYGFQNVGMVSEEHKNNRQWPENVYVYDACANEVPRQLGFGFEQVTEFVTLNKPDVVVIYNDMVVVSNILNKLKAVPDKKFKIIVYIDQVYLYQKKDHIKRLNEEVDLVVAFTPYWEDLVKKQGLTVPTDYLCHGFNKMLHYPVPQKLARQYYGLNENDFIITNLNRNQPRKRWDICLQAFAEVVSRHPDDPIKLLIATAPQGAWNFLEVYERELGKRDVSLADGMKHIILIDRPQQLSDDEINILYNVADVGINTADGEGWGLTSSQQSGIGIPQIVSNVGGHKEFLSKDCALLIDPKYTLYIDASRDGVGGEAEVCDWMDFADAIDTYYADEELRKRHGKNARQKMLDNYSWEKVGQHFYDIIRKVIPAPLEVVKVNLDENLNINDLKKVVDEIEGVAPIKKPKNKPHGGKDARDALKKRLRAKLEEKKNTSKDELLQMKKTIEMLLMDKK